MILVTIGLLIHSGAADDVASAHAPISAPPAAWNLDPFYTKCVFVGPFPVVSSARVHDAALHEAAQVVRQMLRDRPDVIQALADSRTRLAVMAHDELTTDIPEHGDLRPRDYWDRRARGLGATKIRPAVSCGEENLLQFPGDPYHAESILVHEFAHAIHEMALNRLDKEFDGKLTETYQQALESDLWAGTYAATNRREYWAEGVQSYFGTNREHDSDHNHVNTRAELREYDARLFELIDEVFRGNDWQYCRPQDRDEEDRRHLGDFDFESAPTFTWPERLRDVNRTPAR